MGGHLPDVGVTWSPGWRSRTRRSATFGFDGAPDRVSLERMQLTDLGEGRTRLTNTSQFDSFEACDEMVAHGMQQGIEEGYERLDQLIAG